jgi:hypothetical protein
MDSKRNAAGTAIEPIEERAMWPQDQEGGLITLPARVGPVDIEQEIKDLQRDIEFFKQIQILSLKLTKPKDWVIQIREDEKEGVPFPMERGLENIRLAWAVDISGLQLRQEWAEDDLGRYYTYVATGRAYSKKLGSYIEDIGVCSQRDRFFGKIGNKYKEIENVDAANIRRKAVTNLYSRLIRRMTGLMNVTLQDLVEAGFKPEELPAVVYKKGGEKAKIELSEDAKGQAQAIKEIAWILSDGDAKLAAAAIKQSSKFALPDKTEKFAETVDQLTTEPWIRTTYGRIKEMLKSIKPEEYARRYPEPPKQAAAKPEAKK